jgi:small redox-active disulfide protein 2
MWGMIPDGLRPRDRKQLRRRQAAAVTDWMMKQKRTTAAAVTNRERSLRKMGLFGKKKEKNAEEMGIKCSCGNASAGTDSAERTGKTGTSGPKTDNAVSIKVLGSGCKNCQALLQNTKDAVSFMNLPAKIEYITDMKEIAKYGVMSMPALVVNEQVVSMGKVLKPADIQKLLNKIGIA